MNRRNFLSLSGAGAAAFALAVNGYTENRAWASTAFPSYPFALGVASGEPAPDGVVLWTRLAPEPLDPEGRGGMPSGNVRVEWEVAEDESFTRVVRRGSEVTLSELGHSVHAEVTGLSPAREYFYRFRAGSEISPVGRTKTAPARTASPQSLSFALASCQAWVGGRYAAYRNLAAEDLDLVVHVGDYIYEERNTEKLADFRRLHSEYKTSPDLQAAHAAFPFVVTFDDHEIENNWADKISQPDGEASNSPERFVELRAAAFQAYWENMPLRRDARPEGPDMRLYRRLQFGRLAQFDVLDTRQYRDDQLQEGFPSAPLDPRAVDSSRTLTGDNQERWLFNGLEKSTARWNILAQQTIMTQFDYDTGPGVAVNHDQWDGYAASRARYLDFVSRNDVSNPVVLSGDWHSAWVNDLKSDFGDAASKTLATEFVSTSISSGCGWAGAVAAAVSHNPHVKFADGSKRGYTRCTVTPETWRSDFRIVTSAADTADPATTQNSWVVRNGRPGAQQV
ncbi:MAG: alkaline phosphatase D family protein [Streptomyces sp.]|uniref:alkaline phosphatase D family protein n=1 Tax=Streptomyces sp. TaxID=1931 RepID=UPI003D6AAE4F